MGDGHRHELLRRQWHSDAGPGDDSGLPVLYNGRGNLGRSPALVRTDLGLWHNLRLSGSRTVQLQLNIDNLFDQGR